jgi:hypothetical protein
VREHIGLREVGVVGAEVDRRCSCRIVDVLGIQHAVSVAVDGDTAP